MPSCPSVHVSRCYAERGYMPTIAPHNRPLVPSCAVPQTLTATAGVRLQPATTSPNWRGQPMSPASPPGLRARRQRAICVAGCVWRAESQPVAPARSSGSAPLPRPTCTLDICNSVIAASAFDGTKPGHGFERPASRTRPEPRCHVAIEVTGSGQDPDGHHQCSCEPTNGGRRGRATALKSAQRLARDAGTCRQLRLGEARGQAGSR